MKAQNNQPKHKTLVDELYLGISSPATLKRFVNTSSSIHACFHVLSTTSLRPIVNAIMDIFIVNILILREQVCRVEERDGEMREKTRFES